MAKGLWRKGAAGLAGLAIPTIGSSLARKWKNADKKQRAIYLAGGASLVAWAVAGRWLLLPFLGTDKLSEPKETHSGSTQKIKRPDGSELHVEFYGPTDAPVLVLTHGWAQDGTGWYYLKRDLAQRFRLIVWDLPGQGQSVGPSNNDYSLDKMAADLEAVIKLAERPVVLVGHSLGGMVIQTFCRLFPQHLKKRVTGLVLMDTTYANPLKTARWGAFWRALQAPLFVPLWYTTIALSPVVRVLNWLGYLNGSWHLSKRFLGFAGRQTWKQVDFACRMSIKGPPSIPARMALASVKFNEWNTLSQISVPVLVLAGENDRLTRFDVNQQLQQRIPDARLVSFRPGGHYAMLEHHAAFSQAVADFADSCQEKPSGTPSTNELGDTWHAVKEQAEISA